MSGGIRANASLVSLSFKAPSRVVTSRELEARLGLGPGVIERLTGIRARRYLGPGESLQSLAVEACREALARSGRRPEEIGGLIFYTDTPPLLPCAGGYRQVYYDVSAHLHDLLREQGVRLECGCTSIGGSCVAFLHSLEMASGLIRSGARDNILVVGAAANSLFLEGTDKNAAMTFADGAAAGLVASSAEEGLIGFHALTDGRGYDAGYYEDYRTLVVDRKRVAEFAPAALAEAWTGLLARTGLTVDDIDIVIPHQAGIKIVERGMALAGIPSEKVYLCLQDYGNMGAPAVEMALAKAVEDGRVRDGDVVALVAFGTGWNCGAAALRYRPGGGRR